MKATVMSAVKEPFTTQEIRTLNPLQDRFESVCMRRASAGRTFTYGMESCRSRRRLFPGTSRLESSIASAKASCQ
jgi:hypothetical protein